MVGVTSRMMIPGALTGVNRTIVPVLEPVWVDDDSRWYPGYGIETIALGGTEADDVGNVSFLGQGYVVCNTGVNGSKRAWSTALHQ